MKYVYHYHAMTQIAPGSIAHMDGVIETDVPIVDEAEYAKLKDEICASHGRGSSRKVTICSLSLVGAP